MYDIDKFRIDKKSVENKFFKMARDMSIIELKVVIDNTVCMISLTEDCLYKEYLTLKVKVCRAMLKIREEKEQNNG